MNFEPTTPFSGARKVRTTLYDSSFQRLQRGAPGPWLDVGPVPAQGLIKYNSSSPSFQALLVYIGGLPVGRWNPKVKDQWMSKNGRSVWWLLVFIPFASWPWSQSWEKSRCSSTWLEDVLRTHLDRTIRVQQVSIVTSLLLQIICSWPILISLCSLLKFQMSWITSQHSSSLPQPSVRKLDTFPIMLAVTSFTNFQGLFSWQKHVLHPFTIYSSTLINLNQPQSTLINLNQPPPTNQLNQA